MSFQIVRSSQIEAAEIFLKEEGFLEVQVRCYERVARVSVSPIQMPYLIEPELYERMQTYFGCIGFHHVEIGAMDWVNSRLRYI